MDDIKNTDGLKSLVKHVQGLAVTAMKPRELDDGTMVYVVPDGYSVKVLQVPDETVPQYISASRDMHDVESFIDYINTHKTPHTRIFANRNRKRIRAEINCHQSDGVASFNAHSVHYAPEQSDEWARWDELVKGNPYSQEEALLFLEENAIDINGESGGPSAAVILEQIANMNAVQNVKFKKAMRLQDGTTVLSYSDEVTHHGNGEVKFPHEFDIGIPVFFGGLPYRIKIKTRFKLLQGDVRFSFHMDRAVHVLDDAFKKVVDEVQHGRYGVNEDGKRLETPIFHGTDIRHWMAS